MAGSIRKRGKSWAVIYDAGRDPVTGKRRQVWRTVRGTKADAQRELARLQHLSATGIDIAPERLTVNQYLERWLVDYASARVAPSTLIRYRGLLRVHVAHRIGGQLLARLKPIHLQEVYSAMLRDGSAPRTVLHVHRVLHEALDRAVKWDLIHRNPVDAVDPPRPAKHDAPALTVDQVNAIIREASTTPYGGVVQVAVMTGLRQGEVLGLRWADVALDRAVLSVRQSAQRLPGEAISFRQPKTHRSQRPVSLSPALVAFLRAHRLSQLEHRLLLGAAYDDHDLVFATALGTPIDAGNLRRAWTAIAAAAGLRGLRFHDLRHAHATLLLSAGVHPKVVSERLGHSSVTLTLDTYSHVLPSMGLEAAAKLDTMLKPKNAPRKKALSTC